MPEKKKCTLVHITSYLPYPEPLSRSSYEPKAKRFMQESFHMRFMLVFMP